MYIQNQHTKKSIRTKRLLKSTEKKFIKIDVQLEITKRLLSEINIKSLSRYPRKLCAFANEKQSILISF